MPALSTARQLFDRLVAGGSAEIERLVTDKVHETEWLDFKSGEHLDDDKTTWSEAICGFANNQGGVIVWGIDARKDKESGVDAACDVKPVASPQALRSRLLELLRTAVEPPLAGVEVRDVIQGVAGGPGFVVCLVPESDTKPHRAEMLKNKPYIIRIADAFINPSPSLLRSLFFPRSGPRLWVEIEPVWQEITFDAMTTTAMPKDIEVLFRINIGNSGFVSAKDVFAAVSTEPPALTLETTFPKTRTATQFGTGIEYPRAIHPSSISQLCVIRRQVEVTRQFTQTGQKFVPAFSYLKVFFELSATDMITSKSEITLNAGDIEIRRTKQSIAV